MVTFSMTLTANPVFKGLKSNISKTVPLGDKVTIERFGCQ